VNRNAALAVCFSLIAIAAPSHADEAPTREYIVDERLPPSSTRWKTVVGGLGATAVFYGLAQPFSYIWPDAPGSRDLRYPVVGPWMAIGRDQCPPNYGCSTVWSVIRIILSTVDGFGQAGGLGVALEGIFMPTEHEVEAQPGTPKKPRRPSPATPEQPSSTPGNLFYLPRPINVGQSGVGLGIGGMF